MKRFYVILTILISAILTACGGGGEIGPENFIGPPDVLTPARPNVLCANPTNCQ